MSPLCALCPNKNTQFLRKRYDLMSAHHLFESMEYSEDPAQIAQWVPLVMQGRKLDEPVAATRVHSGSDVDFGSLARDMVEYLKQQDNFEILLGHTVEDMQRSSKEGWSVLLEDNETGEEIQVRSKFVFLGAGGGALPLLQKSDIPESEGYGGFPVSGQWLVCTNPEIVDQHHAKVYGKAAIGAPPMSVPHLDTRIINGKPALLFGPFAGFTTKFLKTGSKLDLFKSMRSNNLLPMMDVGIHNMDLTKYLISEVMQSHEDRMKSLREYFPNAQSKNWTLAQAGQRVQIIKKDGTAGGKLEFGTELVAAKDGSLAALLGASPGASVAAQAMIEVIERCLASRLDNGWENRLKQWIPSYGESLIDNRELLENTRKNTLSVLGLGKASS